MIKATYDNVIVRVVHRQERSSIIIPDAYKKRSNSITGEVISVGLDYPYGLEPGDIVIIQQYEDGTTEGIEIIDGDESYLVLAERWVLGRVENASS